MAKKKNASPSAAAGSSLSKDIQELKALNSHLVNEVAELRKQIEGFSSQLHSLTADREIPPPIERDVVHRPLSSTLGQAEARRTAQLDSVTAEGNIPDPIQLDLVARPFFSTLGQAEPRTQLDSLTADVDISHRIEHHVGLDLSSTICEVEAAEAMECSQKDKPQKQKKKNWIFYPIAITAIFFVSTAVVSLCKSSNKK